MSAVLSRHFASGIALLTGLLLTHSGCGEAKRVATIPVTGTVSFKGAPVADAYVVFLPASGPRATGTTDATGRFQLMTTNPSDGAVAWEHVVLVEKSEPANANDPYAKRKAIIPPAYGNPQESPLRQKVAAGGTNDFKIEIQ